MLNIAIDLKQPICPIFQVDATVLPGIKEKRVSIKGDNVSLKEKLEEVSEALHESLCSSNAMSRVSSVARFVEKESRAESRASVDLTFDRENSKEETNKEKVIPGPGDVDCPWS